ncbi:hypothetical protein SLE2022_133040 [Rubroshorea leprosula]
MASILFAARAADGQPHDHGSPDGPHPRKRPPPPGGVSSWNNRKLFALDCGVKGAACGSPWMTSSTSQKEHTTQLAAT